MSAMESQKAAEDNNNKKKNEANINEFGRFIELQKWLSIPALEINKSFSIPKYPAFLTSRLVDNAYIYHTSE